MAEALYQPFPTVGAARAHIWRYLPQNRRPRHFHAEPELNLIAAGTATFGVGDGVIDVAAGDLVAWRPGQDHVLMEASADFDLFVVGLTPALSDRVLADGHLPADVATSVGPLRTRVAPAALATLRAKCLVPLGGQEPSVVERHVGDVWRVAQAFRLASGDMHALTRRALPSLLERPELGRADVARLVRAHPSEVSRYFHRDMGLTVTAYRSRVRLIRFIRAVDDGERSLLAAALAAGFGSYSQCHRAFQCTLGCTPRRFFGASADLRRRMHETFAPWPMAATTTARAGGADDPRPL